MRVYVDMYDCLVTDAGDYLRPATNAEVAQSQDNDYGFIDVPEDVKHLIYCAERDGATRLTSDRSNP